MRVKIIPILTLLALVITSLLVLSDKIFPQKSQQSATEAENSKSKQKNNNDPVKVIENPEKKWVVFGLPPLGYELNLRLVYQIVPTDKKMEKRETILNLMYQNTLLADMALLNPDQAKQQISLFTERIADASYLLAIEELKFAKGDGIFYSAKSNNETKEALLVANYKDEGKTFVMNIKDFTKWVDYPADALRIAQTVNFLKQ